MSTQNHLIQRQLIELTVRKPLAGAALQDQISLLYRKHIVPLVDQVCSELGKPDRIYRIDSLQLDLGTLHEPELEQQFVAKVKTELRKALGRQIRIQEDSAADGANSPKTLSALELFARFARSGNLPWWAGQQQRGLLHENVRQLLEQQPAALRALLQELLNESNACRRITIQYVDGRLAQFCTLLAPALAQNNSPAAAWAATAEGGSGAGSWGAGGASGKGPVRHLARDMQSLIAALQKTATGRAWSHAWIRQRWWQHALMVAAQGGAAQAALAAFYRAVLERFAVDAGSNTSRILDELEQVAGGATGSAGSNGRRGSDMQALAALLSVMAPERAAADALATLLARLQRLQAGSHGQLADAFGTLRAQLAHLSGPRQLQLQARLQAVLAGAQSGAQAAGQLLPLLQSAGLAELQRVFEAALAEAAANANPRANAVTVAENAGGATAALLPGLLRRLHSRGGQLSGLWEAMLMLCARLSPEVQEHWLAMLAGGPQSSSGSSSSAGSTGRAEKPQTISAAMLGSAESPAVLAALGRFLLGTPDSHGLHPADCRRLQNLLRAASLPSAHAVGEEFTVANAGLVMLWPFLSSFFRHLDLLHEHDFTDLAARQRAIGLLQVLAAGQTTFAEYQLPLNKLLCGLDMQHPFDFGPRLRKRERRECEKLLTAVIGQAPILNNMSAAGFRASFLLRGGLLSRRDGHWLLRVEAQTWDIVLSRLPWNWEWIKLPWMAAPLRVEWST